jgi:hypothetical protein
MKSLPIIMLFAISSTASADNELELGIKSGVDSATLSHDNRVGRYGFSGGLAVDLQRSLSERFSIAGQAELLYTARGADVVFDGVSDGGLRQHYFDVAVLARPALRLGPASIYLLAGGSLNVLMRATSEDAMGASQDVTGDLHRLDIALVAGAGVAVPLPRATPRAIQLSTVFLEARHDQGLIDIDTFNGGFKNRTTSIMLGLSFALSSGTATDPPIQSAQSAR